MNAKLISIAAVIIIVIGGLAAALALSGGSDDNGSNNVYEDMSGNMVSMPEEINSIALIGAGALRTFSHLGLASKICSSDQLAKGATYGGSPFMYAFDDYWNQESVKSHSGARQNVNLENILKCNNGEKPDVLAINASVAQGDGNKTTIQAVKDAGIAVFEIEGVQELITPDCKISPLYEKQLLCIGKAFGVEKRAQKLIDGVNAIIEEVKGFRGDVVPPKAYVGGLTVVTARGLNLTSPAYPPFLLAGTQNIISTGSSALDSVVSDTGVSVNIEKLARIINDSDGFEMFVDPAGWRSQKGLCAGDDLVSTALYNKGITTGTVVMPFNAYGLEYDNVLIDCYIVAQAIYDLDPDMIRERIDAVYELYYGDAATNSKGVKLFDQIGDWYFNAIHCRFGEKVTFGDGKIVMTDGVTILQR